MKFADYMKTHGLEDEEMAELIGCSVFAIRKWKYRERTPRPEQMLRIKAATGGMVSADDFMIEDKPDNSGEAA